MTVGDLVAEVRGYVTQDKYLIGRDLAAIEKLLGFHTGRLALGATFVKLNSLPAPGDFELAAYSMTASHRYVAPPQSRSGQAQGNRHVPLEFSTAAIVW